MDHAGRWRVGPTTLWIYRSTHSWHVVHVGSSDPLDESAGADAPVPIAETDLSLENPPPGATVWRYGFNETDSRIHLAPMLADRAVVIRPETPLYILAGEQITLYVSTPVWIRVGLDDGRLLREIPSYRPSDTWFGPSTREGELCYASKTVGRLRLEMLHFRLHRAVTPVRISNSAGDSLHVDRIQVPVQYLSLYQANDRFLWTESVNLDRTAGGDVAAVRVDQTPPREAGTTELLRGPRLELQAGLIMRTFGSIFR